MKIGFMTSVCPQQTLTELVQTAERFGYQGIEFRTEWKHNHGMELGASSEDLAEARRLLADHGLVATCLATSVKFSSPDPSDHVPQRETLHKYVELASRLGAPCIRTFSDPLPEDDALERDRVIALAAESYASVAPWAAQHGVTVLVETHTNMRAHWAREILDRANAANLGVLWHIGHHVSRGQSVDEAYHHIRGLVRHVHFSALGKDVTDAANRRMFELLSQDEYAGFVSVEVINPENPEEVLRTHMLKYRGFMAGLGRPTAQGAH